MLILQRCKYDYNVVITTVTSPPDLGGSMQMRTARLFVYV